MEIKPTSTPTFDTFATPNQFQYSAIEMDKLDASEYTLVNILVDESSSVELFKQVLEDAMGTVLDSCKKHPRSENLLIRSAAFSSRSIREINGFTTLSTADKSMFVVEPEGMTPLWDATLESIETVEAYAQTLSDQDFSVNSIIFLITDGGENSSRTVTRMSQIKDAVKRIRSTEALESIRMILIGVNDSQVGAELTKFKDDAGFDQYVSVNNVDAGSLAKLAQWISQSISSTSQALGSGGPSAAVNFTL